MSEPAHEPSGQPREESPATAAGDEELLAALADDFAARLRRREHPQVEDYVAKHPALAERIRKVLPAIALIEETRTVDPGTASEGPGSTIGRYKLLERIGEGGFGVVYMAEQHHPVRRRVALKVVKPGMDSRQVLARFEAERQALAIMDHPNIAKVFDGGMTDSGRPYFVMELVKGEPITEFCDRTQLPPRQRLELFAQVCHAVQHAHQKGVIHRDIKPSNVLVAMHDTTPVVKVIDFGVAKALGQELTEKTLFTGFAQLVGTPLYMSPEQAGQSSLDVDTRSDIYSLGVLLYELLTGTTPFDKERFRKAAQDEIRRIIREEEPPKPSTRLSESKQSLPSISAQRHMEPAKLVRGELDWIVMKALEKDRNRRYETANGLAADVRRYLADEQVLACPPSAGYQLRKFARRNKAAMAVTALVLCFLVLMGSGIGWAVRDRAAREAEVARDRDARQAKVAGHVELILTEVDRLEREQKWPEALAAARRAEAAVTGGEAGAAIARRVHASLKGLELIDRLEQIRMLRTTQVQGKRQSFVEVDQEYARAFRQHGVDVDELTVEASIERLKARPALAIPLASALDDWVFVRRVVQRDAAGWNRLVAVGRGIDPELLRDRLRATWGQPVSKVQDDLRRLAESIDIRAQHPQTLLSLALTLERVTHSDSAVRILRDAQYVYPGDFWLNYYLGSALYNQKDREGAIRFYTAAVSIRPNSAAALNNLGLALSEHGKVDEAIACYRKAIEIEPKYAIAHSNIGLALVGQKKLDEAIAAYRKAIDLDPNHVSSHYGIGAALHKQKKLDEAIAACRKAIELDPKYSLAYIGLGHTLGDQNKPDEAIAAYRTAIELDPKSALAYNGLGHGLRRQNKLDEAVAAHRKAIEVDPKSAFAYDGLGVALSRQKELDEAVAAHRMAIALDPNKAAFQNNLGGALVRQKKPDEAIACFKKALELDPKLAESYNNLGTVLRAQKKLDEANAAYRKAIEIDPQYADARGSLAWGLNNQAWALATDAEPERRDPGRAVTMAKEAVELKPKEGSFHNTLGAALYRAERWKDAIETLERADQLSASKHFGDNAIFIAMSHWQLGNKEEARRWYERAVEWMDKQRSTSETLKRSRNEAAELLGVNEKKQRVLSTAPAQPSAQTPKK